MSLVGQTKLEFSKGVATTTALTITYAPSSDVPVEASLSLGGNTFVSPILRVALRACEAGEELALGGTACSVCPAGSYGFDPALPCASCPDYATCAGGLSVVLGAAKGCENPNFKGSYLGRFPLVLAVFWTSDHLSERSRGMSVVS